MQGQGKPVILAIDDDPIILYSLATVLEAEYSVRPFKSGAEAFIFLKTKASIIDLIFLDHSMPGMTGFDILIELQDDPATRDIPVIFLTGALESEVEIAALELGAVDFITKPIHPKILLARTQLQIELLYHRRHLESLVEERTRSLNQAYNKLKVREDVTLKMLARATDLRDHDTGGHIERTTEYVRIIVEDILNVSGDGYALTRAEAKDIIRSSKLHDLGKIAIPDHVLLKPGRLTDEEFKVIKEHTTNGQQFLDYFISEMEDSFLHTARDIAHFHHERWDGTGYPGLRKGKDIPLPARIVAIADVYDALVSTRPYKTAFSHEKSVQIILESSGTHFDPYLVRIFERHAEEIRQVSLNMA
ncbi:MAG: response regulator [Treponema sp.]|jgi:putative two-component system response regulator|nr:response regulator [Treponema sp.]